MKTVLGHLQQHRPLIHKALNIQVESGKKVQLTKLDAHAKFSSVFQFSFGLPWILESYRSDGIVSWIFSLNFKLEMFLLFLRSKFSFAFLCTPIYALRKEISTFDSEKINSHLCYQTIQISRLFNMRSNI